MERRAANPLLMTLTASLLAAAPQSAHTARINYQLEASLLDSDNIGLDSENETSATVIIPRLRFDALQEGSRVRLQARGEVEYRHYNGNEFPNESRGEFAGQLNWAALPDRMHLVFEDYLSYQPIDLREGSSPGNLQRTNVWIAGPSFIVGSRDRTRAVLDLRASRSDAEVTEDFDGDRYTAAARVQHRFSPTQTGSINLISTKAEFDSILSSPDHTRHDAFVQYGRTGSKVDITADVGRSRFRADGQSGRSSTLVRVDIDWRATARSTLSGRVRHQLTESVQDLITRHGELTEPMIPQLARSVVLVSSDVYRQRRAELDYRFRGERLTARLRPRHQRARYISNSLNDQNIREGYFEVGYRLRPTVTVSARGSARERNYIEQQRKDRDRAYGLGVEHQLNSHWSWQAEVMRNTRDSTAKGRDYTENSIGVSVTWRR